MKSLIVLTFLVWNNFFNAFASDDLGLTINTNKGPVEGKTIENFNGKTVSAFLGIPFAKPPLGELRFKAPEEISPWVETYKAHDRPIACAQDISVKIVNENNWWRIPPVNESSEDCLYLNVWVPNPRPVNASVMVWIYPGGFEFGSTDRDKFQGELLAAEQDVVVVSMNYRLSIFGHLYLDSEIDGNAALKDQALALKWVKENIAEFGGNPDSVTLFGVSAGGISIGYHLILPTSRDLFNRAIIMSGPTLNPTAYNTKEKALKRFIDLATFSGCQTENATTILNCFRQIETKQLFEMIKNAPKAQAFISFTPVIDGNYLTHTPYELFTTSGVLDNSKEIIIGEPENDGGMFLIFLNFVNNTEESVPTPISFTNGIKRLLGGNELLTKVAQHIYTNWENPNDPKEMRKQLLDIISDSSFKCGLNVMADLATANGNKVYQYSFGHKMSKSRFTKWLGAVHGEEHDSFFGWPLDPDNGFTTEEASVAKTMMTFYGNFAKTGNPNFEGEREGWPKYTANEKAYLDIKFKPEIKYKKRARHCAFWNQLVPDLIQSLGKLPKPAC